MAFKTSIAGILAGALSGVLVLAAGIARSDPAPAPKIFAVDAYGARANGAADDGPAIRCALEAAIALEKPATVAFTAGKSYYVAYDEKAPYFDLNGGHDVTIDGRGAMLLLQAPGVAVFVRGARHCTVENLTVDYAKLPYTQGTIVAVDHAARTFDLRLDPGYDDPATGELPPYPGQTALQWISVLAPTGLALDLKLRADAVVVDDVGAVPGADRTYRVTIAPESAWAVPNLVSGDRSFLPTPVGLKGATLGAVFDVSGSSDIVLKNLTVYSSPFQAFHLFGNIGRVTIDGCQVRVRPGTGRVMSTRRDGIYCEDCRIGPIIENCEFEGLMDDSINICTKGWPVAATAGEASISVRCRSGSFFVGDTIQAYDAISGTILGQSKVNAVKWIDGGAAITLASPIRGVSAQRDQSYPNTVIYNLSLAGNNYVISGNMFGPQRRYAALVRAHDGLIENNTIFGGSGIELSNEAGNFSEGPAPENIIVRGNRFTNGPGIRIEAFCKRPQGRAARDIVLEDNEFDDMVRWPITIRNARNVVLKNTTIRQTGPLAGAFPPLSIENSADVRFDGSLTIVDNRPSLACLLQLSKVSAADMASIHIDWRKAVIRAPALSPDSYIGQGP